MSLQKQHFHLSYWKALSVGVVGVEPAASRSADRRLSNSGANQAAYNKIGVPTC